MPAAPSTPTWQRLLIITASVFLTAAALYFARSILIPIVVSILLTFILTPLVNGLERRGLGRIPSVVVIVSVASLIVLALSVGFFWQIQTLAGEIPNYKETIFEKLDHLQHAVEAPWWEGIYNTVQEALGRIKSGSEPVGPERPVAVVQTDYWGAFLAAAGPILSFLVDVGLVVVLLIFMLIAREDLRNRVLRLSGTQNLAMMTRALDDASSRMSRFLIRQLLMNVAYGVCAGLGLILIGVPYAFLFGFLTAVLRYIPYLGGWIAAFLPAVMALAVFPSWWPLILVAVLYTLLELGFSNFVEPYVYGHSVGVSEVAMIVAAVFWTWLWGPMGLLLTAPLTACLVMLGQYLPYFDFLLILLGDRPVLKTHVVYFQRLLARDHDEATDIVEAYLKDHAPETVHDDLLLPALTLAKTNYHHGNISARDLRFICQTTYDIVTDTIAPEQRQQQPVVNDGPVEKLGQPASSAVVLGVPARDEIDHLALRLLDQLLEDAPCRLQILRSKTRAKGVLAAVREHDPSAVCIIALPPGGLTQTRSLCRRLRAHFPELKLLVASGSREPHLIQRLQSHADEVVATLRDLAERVKRVVEPDKVPQEEPQPVVNG